ncbi:hypothetical protein NQZ68_036642 [Dissostichus eleginoides]|nr:hypothetical protein NQZ68_036642 [Dissostichus eleginoides]
MCVYTWAALPVVISILTFLSYTLLGPQLTAAKSVGFLPLPAGVHHAGSGGDVDPSPQRVPLEAKASLERIQRFFKLTNQDLQASQPLLLYLK